MKRAILMLVLLFLMLTPNLSFAQNELLALAKDVDKQTTILKSISDDVGDLHIQILTQVSPEEAYYNSQLRQIIHRIYIVYYFTNGSLQLIRKGILRDGMIDVCKDKMCKDLVWLHYYLGTGAKNSAKTHLEVALSQLRILTAKIKNTRLSDQLNRVVDITSSTLELINKTESK